MAVNLAEKKYTLIDQYDTKCRLYQSFLSEIEHQITSILQTSQVVCNAITSRLKTRESLTEKIERKQNKYADLAEITDIAGVRIITYYAEDVDKVADIIESEFVVDKENSIDKRESLEPDRFGYCSVHYVVSMSEERTALRECQAYKGMKCEIQIRSVLQHAWAEIEHDIGYKSEIAVPKEMRRSFSRLAGLLEIADREFNDIRRSLANYKEAATQKIQQDEFMDKEIDAVLVETIINTNPKVQQLGKHIASILNAKLKEQKDRGYIEATIRELDSLGVKTVRQLYSIIDDYYDTACYIATELLKDYISNEEEEVSPAIAVFYLEYAILLTERCTHKQIEQYLVRNDIGEPEKLEETVKELYSIGKAIDKR